MLGYLRLFISAIRPFFPLKSFVVQIDIYQVVKKFTVLIYPFIQINVFPSTIPKLKIALLLNTLLAFRGCMVLKAQSEDL